MPLAILRSLVHPERELRSLAGRVTLRSAVATVALSGVATAALQLISGVIEPAGRAAAPAEALLISLLLPLLLLLFWLGAAALVDVAAKIMAAPGGRARFRNLSACTYPVMAGYAMVTLVQAIIDRSTGNAGLTAAIGVLNLAILLWFIALNAVAVRVVYDLQPLNAAVAALFPYAALSGLLMLLIVVASILHAVGAA